MTAVMSASIGIVVVAAVLHATLGMRRPLARDYLSFAGMMTFLAGYFYFGLELFRATTSSVAVEAVRCQVLFVLGCHACLLVFVPAYTRVPIPRSVMAVYWGGLAILFVTNLWAPYGLWFSGPPELVRSTFFGEPYEAVLAPPMSFLQHAYAVYFTSFLLLASACAIKLFRSGERQRGFTFAAAVVVVLACNLVDFVRDTVGGSWPYVAELGFVTWALIMMVQLAHDFRTQAAALAEALAQVGAQSERLSAILDALRMLEKNMHRPIERLEVGVAALTGTSTQEEALLRRLRRAVARLRECARSMPDLVGAGDRGAGPL